MDDAVVAVALYDFNSTAADEISLREGELITGVVKDSEDWWIGTREDGKRGLFPGM